MKNVKNHTQNEEGKKLTQNDNEKQQTFVNSVVRNQLINPEKFELAKNFRKNPTKSEEEVWKLLRNRNINNLKWRRQQIIDGFIADFYCSELNLVLEIDGSVHDGDEAKEYDEMRTAVFESRGIKTIRIKNEHCDKQHLIELIENYTSQPPLYSPLSTMERGLGGEV